MNGLITYIPHLLALACALLAAPFVHEYSHWFVGWLGKTQPKVRYWYVIPSGVEHGKIENMDSALIRFSGMAIFSWIPSIPVAFAHLVFNPSPLGLFIAIVPLTVVLMSSESDAIAVRSPERFRERAINDGFDRNALFFPSWFSFG